MTINPLIYQDYSSRIAALKRYRNLDYSSDSEFQTITQLTADICETSICFITFVDENEVELLFTHGFKGEKSVPRGNAFCAKTILMPELLEIPDTYLDPEFKNNSLVTKDPKIRSYAGMPLITYDGHTIGTLCVMNHRPKKLSPFQINSLTQFSKIVIKLIEFKLTESISRTNESFVMAIDEIVYDHDACNKKIKWGGAYTRILGFSKEEMGKDEESWLSKVHPEDLSAVLNEYEAVKTENRLYNLEYRFARRDGNFIWVHDRGVMHFDKDGQAIQTIGIIRDINEKKLIELKLQERETRYSSLVNTAPVCIHEIDLEGFFASMNPSGLEMLNLETEEQVRGTPYLDGVAKEDYARIKHLLDNALLGQKSSFEFTGTSGDIYSSCFVPIKDMQGQVTRLMGISENISTRKHSEQDLREMNIALSHSMPGIARLDLNGNYTYVNEIYAGLLGYIPEELIGQSWKMTVDSNDIVTGERGYQQMLEQETVEFDIKGIRKDRSPIFKHVLISKRIDSKGNFIGHLCFMKDITEQVESEQRQKQLQIELNHVARLSNMDQMATGLAHEINQPLTAISHYCDAVQTLLTSDPIAKERLIEIQSSISEQVLRAGEIVRHCRQFSSKQSMERCVVDLNELTQETVRFLDSDAHEHNVSILVAFDEKLPPVVIDKVQIQQVLVNLIRNGLEAMQNNNGAARDLTINTHLIDINKSQPKIQVTVKDTGPGLELEQIDNLFQPFYTTKKNGMGMGLSISRSIIDAHGGMIWADNQNKQETQFHFTLPVNNNS